MQLLLSRHQCRVRMNAASSVRRPMNRDSHVKNSVLANSKKPAKKVAVYVRKNKQTYITSENVISNKENVIDVDVANAPKAKTLLCVSCMQNVLIPCHDNCFANYKLNVRSNVCRPLSTKSRTPKSYDTTYVVRKTRFSKESTLSKSLDTTYVVRKTRFSKESTLSKSLDTTYVVSKPNIDVRSTSKANDKVVQMDLPMFEEYFEKTFFDTPINSAAQPTQIHEDSPSTSSITVDEHEAPPIVTTSDEQISPISLTEADEFNQKDLAHSDGNSQFVSYNPPSSEEIE
ncbi:hypothetical protein Tco_1443265, partial [Tanacetum coccineum]